MKIPAYNIPRKMTTIYLYTPNTSTQYTGQYIYIYI